VGGTPEILTSFPDFERIYGGIDNLSGLSDPINYLAHAVNAFFDNGGGRLYVSRAFLGRTDGTGTASTADLTSGGADATKQTFFKARFPGDAGNGSISATLQYSPATKLSMDKTVEGTLLRLGGDTVAQPAQVSGGMAPFSLPEDSTLVLTVNGTDAPAIHFHGESAEAVGAVALADPIPLTDPTRTLQVTIDGAAQTITVPGASIARADLVDFVNAALIGGYAHRTADQKLAIGSDKRGKLSSVIVTANATAQLRTRVYATGFNSPVAVVQDRVGVDAGVVQPGAVVPAVVRLDPTGTRLDGHQRGLEVRRLGAHHRALDRVVGDADRGVLHRLVDGRNDLVAAVLETARELHVGLVAQLVHHVVHDEPGRRVQPVLVGVGAARRGLDPVGREDHLGRVLRLDEAQLDHVRLGVVLEPVLCLLEADRGIEARRHLRMLQVVRLGLLDHAGQHHALGHGELRRDLHAKEFFHRQNERMDIEL